MRRYLARKYIPFKENSTNCIFCVPVENSRWTTQRDIQPIIDMIKKLAIKQNKTDEGMICKIASSMLYKSNRKLSQIFQKIGNDPENFESKFKYSVPKKEAIQMKIKMKLSVSQYDIMREFLSDYIIIRCHTTLKRNMIHM